jgi:hypothetical protein
MMWDWKDRNYDGDPMVPRNRHHRGHFLLVLGQHHRSWHQMVHRGIAGERRPLDDPIEDPVGRGRAMQSLDERVGHARLSRDA